MTNESHRQKFKIKTGPRVRESVSQKVENSGVMKMGSNIIIIHHAYQKQQSYTQDHLVAFFKTTRNSDCDQESNTIIRSITLISVLEIVTSFKCLVLRGIRDQWYTIVAV
jgi:hypothetical protein